MRPILLPLFAIALIVGAWVATPARADEPGDSIRSVIESQIAAFRANDLEGAYAFASPMIQKKFGNPQFFGQMVETGYPMIWRPSRYEMLRLEETPSGLVQVVLFEDATGRLHEAGYLMELLDGKWRINGVHVRHRPGVGT